jgi:hypothetical protein
MWIVVLLRSELPKTDWPNSNFASTFYSYHVTSGLVSIFYSLPWTIDV